MNYGIRNVFRYPKLTENSDWYKKLKKTFAECVPNTCREFEQETGS